MSLFIVDNAITWVQFRIKGGWKNLLYVGGGYGGIVVASIALLYESAASPGEKAQALQSASSMLLVGQFIILLLMGTQNLTTSIRADLTSRQIESHRLMPLAPIAGVTGYLVGSTARAMWLALITFAIGTAIRANGVSIDQWYFGNAVILTFAIMFWSVMVMAAFTSRWVMWLIVALCGVILFSRLTLLQLLPGLAIICNIQEAIRAMNSWGPAWRLDEYVLLFIGMQFLVAIVCLLAAANKYAHGDRAGLPVWFGLGLFLIWIAASAYGIEYYFDSATTAQFTYDSYDIDAVLIATVFFSLVVGMLVMSCLAHHDNRNEYRRFAGASISNKDWILFPAALVLCVVAIAGVSRAVPHSPTNPAAISWIRMMQGNGMVLNGAWETPSPIHKRWGVVGAEATIFLLEMYLVMRLLYTPRVNRANLAVFGVVAMLICIPLADLIESNINNPNVTPKMNHYSLLSPLGMIIQADEPEPPRLWVGLLGQSVILAGMGSLYILVWGRRRRRMRKGDGSLVGVVTQVDPSE